MKCVVQRVSRASVTVYGEVVGEVGKGLLVLVGIQVDDTEAEVDWMARKLTSLRVFADAEGNMDLNVEQVEGGLLLVSQFTLYGELKKGTRPSFIRAARPETAEPLYSKLVDMIRDQSSAPVATGRFGAMMDVELVNDGPVTVILEREPKTNNGSAD